MMYKTEQYVFFLFFVAMSPTRSLVRLYIRRKFNIIVYLLSLNFFNTLKDLSSDIFFIFRKLALVYDNVSSGKYSSLKMH